MMRQSAKPTASRRPPAHRSVSLKHASAPGDSLPPRQASQRSSEGSSLVANRHSSGENSNVEAWFDKSNKDVLGHAALFNDSDSPFTFEDNDSPQRGVHPYPTFLPLRPPLMMRDSGGSSSEDFRSVIDDLTIENKKLKKRLRKFEKARDPQLQKDKLFEVKVLGLPPEKKRELEETLRRFAANLGNSGSGTAASTGFRPAKVSSKPTSSLTSTRVADSGYGSLGVSGKASTAHSAQGSHASTHFDKPQARVNRIQSYLHDIPEGLLPKHATAMSEKSRKKLVVRRLEQIFAGGKGMDSRRTEQPMQQEEISQSAAKADRNDLESRGQKARDEGIREAQIMDLETENFIETPENAADNAADNNVAMVSGGKDLAKKLDPVAQLSVEQRPTRPLDLDPHRTQDPSENIEYIKHLGFLESEENPTVTAEDDQNWIYLNLLVNMAQLHTVNVTIDFVKQAISDYSSKIELSSDGRKVRWRGESEGTVLGDSSPETNQDSNDSGAACDTFYGCKRDRPSYVEASSASGGPVAKKQLLQDQQRDKFAYTPLFARDESSESESNVSMGDAEYSPSSPEAPGISPENSLSLKRTELANARADGGSIIFYNNATFCTDLSGDRSQPLRHNAPVNYKPSTSTPLGSGRNKARSGRNKVRSPSVQSSVKGSEGSTFDVSSLSSSLALAGSESKLDLNFPSAQSPTRRVAFAEPEVPILLEASGVGGVTPEDNMTITVVRQYEPAKLGLKPKTRPKPSRLSGVLSKKPQASPRPMAERVISTHQRRIDPSPLPPASLHFGVGDSESDSDSSCSDSNVAVQRQDMGDKQNLSTVASPPRLAPLPYSDQSDDGYSDEEEEEEEEDDSDDQSLDFLAGVRAADPAAARMQEREYDAEVAERLADDIPAGSSAATAGGGSGFNSPELRRHIEEEKEEDEDDDDDDEEMAESVSS